MSIKRKTLKIKINYILRKNLHTHVYTHTYTHTLSLRKSFWYRIFQYNAQINTTDNDNTGKQKLAEEKSSSEEIKKDVYQPTQKLRVTDTISDRQY